MELEKKKGISGAVLKWVAVVSMFVDHFTAVLVEGSWKMGIRAVSYDQYLVLRGIGRLAFPIYCFLLTEAIPARSFSSPARSLRMVLSVTDSFSAIPEIRTPLCVRSICSSSCVLSCTE